MDRPHRRAIESVKSLPPPGTPALPIVPKDEEITDERMVIVKQRRAELDRQIEPLLSPEQLTTFKAIQSNLHIINPYDGSVTLGYTWPQN